MCGSYRKDAKLEIADSNITISLLILLHTCDFIGYSYQERGKKYDKSLILS